MKKLLTMLGAVGLTATAGATVIACSSDKETSEDKEITQADMDAQTQVVRDAMKALADLKASEHDEEDQEYIKALEAANTLVKNERMKLAEMDSVFSSGQADLFIVVTQQNKIFPSDYVLPQSTLDEIKSWDNYTSEGNTWLEEGKPDFTKDDDAWVGQQYREVSELGYQEGGWGKADTILSDGEGGIFEVTFTSNFGPTTSRIIPLLTTPLKVKVIDLSAPIESPEETV
ncbi:lipoprotein [Mesoplasma photuris]|uniref:lipoprotein n=1 Tax=Mesoplasma photuris TaxID=217731 RepID=UPI0004E140B4|nr:lipoprotein [Mesoplasma photuris]